MINNHSTLTDQGLFCLLKLCKSYGVEHSLPALRTLHIENGRECTLQSLGATAEQVGLKTSMVLLNKEMIAKEIPFGMIVGRQDTFVVVSNLGTRKISVLDPLNGNHVLSQTAFKKKYLVEKDELQALIVQPSLSKEQRNSKGDFSTKFLLFHLKPYRKFALQLIVGMLIGNLLLLITPFLTQSIVDVGIENQDIGFINLILVSQLALFAGSSAVEFIRGWIVLHMGTRINVTMISNFLAKIMGLPVTFFENKPVGKILQNIGDHRRVESFLTNSAFSLIFSILNLIAFSLLLAYYNLLIFAVFVLGAVLYILWIIIFLPARKSLDQQMFEHNSKNQTKMIQIISGIQDIKLYNSEVQKRWEWERIQAALFKTNIKSLALQQYQKAGSTVIFQISNIFISYLAAISVIEGKMTLGMLLAIQFVIGQLTSPINSIISFISSYQDAKISIERIKEIYDKKDESSLDKPILPIFPAGSDIVFSNVCFRYRKQQLDVLRNINLVIPKGKVTAIVGASGSGKTTLLKLLLKFQYPTSGEIKIGSTNLVNIGSQLLRRNSAAVFQNGFIFSDSIASNIALGEDAVDHERLLYSIRMANLEEYVNSLPQGIHAQLTQNGNGLSQGQRQRMLIARAIYRDPHLLYFDEATSSLDANNEKIIMQNLQEVFAGRTVVIVAHRLSTVKNADQIIVLNHGEIVELGDHETLARNRGTYYNLVKNQLELGN